MQGDVVVKSTSGVVKSTSGVVWFIHTTPEVDFVAQPHNPRGRFRLALQPQRSIFAGYIVSRHKRLAKSATAAVKTAITASMINRFTCRPDRRAAVASIAKWIKMAAG